MGSMSNPQLRAAATQAGNVMNGIAARAELTTLGFWHAAAIFVEVAARPTRRPIGQRCAAIAAYLEHHDEERTMLPLLGERVPPLAMVAMNAATLPLAERAAFLDKLLARVTPSERRTIEHALAQALDAAQ